MDAEAITDIVVYTLGQAADRSAALTGLRALLPNGDGAYGYLTWRYSEASGNKRSGVKTWAAQQDFSNLVEIVGIDTHIIESLVREHGPVLDSAAQAKNALNFEIRNLTEDDDFGPSIDDELRRSQGRLSFLRRALILLIASQQEDQRLWDLLDPLRPPRADQVIEMTSQLNRANNQLNKFISGVHRLLATDTSSLQTFFARSASDLTALREGRYDFLTLSLDGPVDSTSPEHSSRNDLQFAVLPPGELRRFLDGLRASNRHGGRPVDERRVAVLEELVEHFGQDRCTWHKGSPSSDGVDNRYLILSIRRAGEAGEDAVAISPLVGQHATYLVRHDRAEAEWRSLFARSKFDARLGGAKKLLFTSDGHTDPYKAMRRKIIGFIDATRPRAPSSQGAWRRW